MSKRIMIKKHMLTYSVLLVLMIISRLFVFSKNAIKTVHGNHVDPGKNTAVNGHEKHGILGFITYKKDTIRSLNFANETLPLGDKKVRGKMARSLRLHSFKQIQSNLLQRKAEKIFPVIEPILKAYGIPDDFKFIPLVESGFGEGKSSRGAFGPWQFMAGTARTYGLKVNKNHDDRVSIRRSTIAACKYLLELHTEFKSWVLVAAAYNTGSINLARLIRTQKQTNYFRIKMNSETGVYVYNLIAMKQIINDPQANGFTYNKLNHGIIPQYNSELLAFN